MNNKIFDIDILNNLANHHKKLMELIKNKINTLEFINNGELYFFITKYFEDNGLNKAFPIGISINQIIAHDSWHPLNVIKFNIGDFIKVDIGLEDSGNIIDSARTFEYIKLVNNNNIPKSINDCKQIVSDIEKWLQQEINTNNNILIQKISRYTNEQIVSKGYKSLDFLGGHNIEKGHVHGKKLILNKPLDLLPEICKNFINKDETIGEGEMFAIEVYISDKPTSVNGTMIQNTLLPITHYELNSEFDSKFDSKFDSNLLDKKEKEIFNFIKTKTKMMPYDFSIHNGIDLNIIKNMIKKKVISTHLPLEWVDNSKSNIKYVQYEDCYIILDGKIINLTG